MTVNAEQPYNVPTFELVVAGRNITRTVNSRLIRLTLAESRGDEADQLDIEIDDSDGKMNLPAKGAKIALRLGWQGWNMVDKGEFVVDEVEHAGAPDRISIRARAADMKRELRARAEHSYHDTTLDAIVRDVAQRNGLQAKVDPTLADIPVAHVDQTHESDLHFLTRLAKQHDAVCTVKKGRLAFIPINSGTNAAGQALEGWTITRADGDQHRYSSSTRDAFEGVKAYWSDRVNGRRKSVVAGKKDGSLKTLKETYASEQDALAAARAERQRLERGMATFELALAVGRPEITAQSPIKVTGWKEEIDGEDWLVKEVTHTLNDGNGWTSKAQMERGGADTQK